MQAAVQPNNSLLSFQTNMNVYTPAGNRASSQMPMPMPMAPAAQFNGARNPASQMSNMMGHFSQTSFSISSQNTRNGQSSTFYAQGTISNSGQPAFQQPTRPGGNFDHAGYSNPMPGNRYDNRADSRPNNGFDNCSRGSDRTPSRNDCGCKDSGRADQTQWSNTAVSNNKASINLGDYKLDFDKSDSSMTMTNNKTGDKTEIYGDPHLTQHVTGSKSNSSTAMFNGPMTFMLPDNTKVTVSTTPATNNKSISFADQVTITKGNQAYQVTGLSQQNKAGLNVQRSNDGRALDAATPDGYTLQAARDGSGWIDPATGKAPTPADIKKANT
jgi:hypothetical protein